MTQNIAQNKTSIKELLGPEYNTVFSVNASQSVNTLFNHFAPQNPDILFFREKVGDLYLGEMPALMNDYAFRDSESVWQKPLQPEILPENIKFALHKDKALPQIMQEVFPDQHFDPSTPTLAALISLSNIYHAGITVRLAEYKKQDFINRMDNICDPALYAANRARLMTSKNSALREFAAYAPETPAKLVITAKKENIVKGIERVLEKSLDYDPSKNPNPNHLNGVFGVRDIHRTSVSVENPKNMTMTDWINARNQIAVSTLSDDIGMDLKKVKDVVAESRGNTCIFPRCLLTGSNYYKIDNHFYVGFSSELQLNPCSDDFGRYTREITTDYYNKSRSKSNKNTKQKQMFSILRDETLHHYLHTHFPQMAQTIMDPDYVDHSYLALKQAIAGKPKPIRDEGSTYVNLSHNNFLDPVIQNLNGYRVMRTMIKPLPQHKLTL
jgi:hypothetical protein